jgi:amino acid adenylation domain-containing protein
MLRNAGDLLTRESISAVIDKVAVVDGSHRVRYGELLQRAERQGVLLTAMGVRKGDRVVIFLRRSVESIAALFGTWFAGGVAVVANDRLRTQQIHHIVEHSEASCVITDSRQLLAVPSFPCPRLINVDQVTWPQERCSRLPLLETDLALLMYTSGSTGLPKGVMTSHDNLLAGARIVSRYLELTDRDVILSVLPFSFDYGLNQLLTSLFVGGTLVIQHSLFPPDICHTLVRERITGLAGVPTLWLQLTGRLSPFLKISCPTLRYMTNSGGRLPEATVRLIRAVHPHTRIYLMYGLTEAFRSTFLPPDQVDRRPSSIGKAIPEVEVLVINDQGALCRPGEVGELVHCGPTVALGYWRDAESTAHRFRPHPVPNGRNAGKTVVFSGDLVTLDDEGYLSYVGRRDKQIKSRGIRVSPEEIERCISSSALVSNVVTFALARDDGENDIVAAVVPADPARFCEQTLEEFCRKEMPDYMWPRVVWPLDAFPLTSSGKPDRGRIEQMYVEHTQRPAHAARAARTA